VNRFDRALAILLVLQQGKTVSATSLARQFEVSTRTIYRDVETLAAVGVPVYTEMGREGGFRLVEGFFLPPVMFSVGEGVSLLLGLTLVRSLSVRPFATELERATEKLLAAMPDHLRHTLAEAQKVVGFEGVAEDAFHVERANVAPDAGIAGVDGGAGLVVGQFLQAILDRRGMSLEYRSPYSDKTGLIAATPCGVLWDRDRWYLVGQRPGGEKQWRLWRADRVINLRVGEQACGGHSADAFPGRPGAGRLVLSARSLRGDRGGCGDDP
jgi:predicted DNA-binding transcriptional regulator YafY